MLYQFIDQQVTQSSYLTSSNASTGTATGTDDLGRRLLEVFDELAALLFLLDAREDHLRACVDGVRVAAPRTTTPESRP